MLQDAHLSHQLLDHRHDPVVLGEALVGHVSGSALGADENVPVPSLKADVLHVRAQPAVGLAKHGLWPERGSHQEDVFSSQATGGKKYWIRYQNKIIPDHTEQAFKLTSFWVFHFLFFFFLNSNLSSMQTQ